MKEKGCCTEEVLLKCNCNCKGNFKAICIGILAAAALLQLNQPCSSEACGRSRRSRRKPERVGSQVAAAAAAAAQAAAAEVQAVLSN